MCRFQITYPNYSMKAFTMSYDDGPKDDARVMALCKEYGIACTFALNTGFFGRPFHFTHKGHWVEGEKWQAKEIASVYAGFEVAGHSHSHPMLAQITDPEALYFEIATSNQQLSDLVGYQVCGFTYPNNSYSDTVIQMLRQAGVVYSRTTETAEEFSLPEDFLRWNVTGHDHDPDLLQRIDAFAARTPSGLECAYVWGHAYEFQKPDPHRPGETGTRWDDFTYLIAHVAQLGQFWFATNADLYRYQAAAKQLSVTADSLYNPSRQPLYGLLDNRRIVLQPGQRLAIRP